MNLAESAATGVSVVLPTYNRRDRLLRSVRSVLAQSHRELELIVVDDGSTEDIQGLLSTVADSRIRYLRCAERGGAATARNMGIREARYEWIAFQDSDDEWRPGKLATQLEAATGLQGSPQFICSTYLVLPRGGKPGVVGVGNWPESNWSAADCHAFPFITPTWLVRRDILLTAGLFDGSLPNLEDWELAFRLVRQGRVHVLQQPQVIKHGSADGVYHDTVSRLRALEAIYERHLDLWRQDPKVMAAFLEEIGRLRCHNGILRDGRSALMASLRLHPSRQALIQLLVASGGERAYGAMRSLKRRLRK